MKKVVEFTDKKLIEQEAADWLIKLDGDEDLSTQDKELFHAWLNRSALHRKEFEAMAKSWSDANILTELAVPLNRPLFSTSTFSSKRFAAVAASFFLIFGVGLFFLFQSTLTIQRNGTVVTEIGHQKTLKLSDGSVVKLNTNSQVQIDYTKKYRNIHLIKGEAHFTVAKNKKKPFRVYAGTGRIHAIGTAFSVYLKADIVDVTVSEGRVGVASLEVPVDNPVDFETISVSSKPVKSLGMLRAGEAGSIVSQIDQGSKKVQKLSNVRKIDNVDIAKELSWTDGVLVFAGEPLEEVVTEIGRYTDVAITFSDPELKTIRIGGRFPVGETETMFASLETNFGLQVTRLDSDNVVISSARDQ